MRTIYTTSVFSRLADVATGHALISSDVGEIANLHLKLFQPFEN
jgi:hypothetical protein